MDMDEMREIMHMVENVKANVLEREVKEKQKEIKKLTEQIKRHRERGDLWKDGKIGNNGGEQELIEQIVLTLGDKEGDFLVEMLRARVFK